MPSPASPDDVEAVRRSRKREHDRRAQRALRERTRNRIAQLEATVDALSHQGSDSHSAGLIEQLALVSKERDELKDVLSQVETTVQKYTRQVRRTEDSANDDLNVSHETSQQQQQSCDAWLDVPALPSTLPNLTSNTNFNLDRTGQDSESNSNWCGDAPAFDAIPGPHDYDLSPSQTDASHTAPLDSLVPFSTGCESEDLIVPPPDTACECTPHAPLTNTSIERHNIWRMANSFLKEPVPISKAILQYEDAMSEDIAVRVVLEGWDSVNESTILSPLWRKLRHIDDLQFKSCPDAERLAILTTMHLLLRCHAEPTTEQRAKIPLWLHQRPSQTMIPHSYAINFFVWPGLRERFVFSQHRYCSNDFWYYFTNNFRITWPFEFRDCYNRNRSNGKLSIGAEFKACISDIKSWTMSTDFFGRFPELHGDIPAFRSIPVYIPDKRETEEGAISLQHPQDQTISHAQSWPVAGHWRDDMSLVEPLSLDIATSSMPLGYNCL
ncbi:Nn.00g021090.m01.CDS01 [Neocucurbitaria sp. VM-36]